MLCSATSSNLRWRYTLTLAGLCVALLGGASPASLARPVPIAQASSRSPEIITGELTANSPVLEDSGRYYEFHTFEGIAGEAITIELTSEDFNALLILVSPDKEPIAHDDDGAGGTNARITLTLPTTGTYILVVTNYGSGETGAYQLTTRTATAEDQALDQASQLNQQVIDLHQAGRYVEAVPLAEQALAIREASLGPEHPETATSLNNLAELYKAQGRHGKAEPLLQQALAIREAALGPEHPETAASLNNLALLYHSQGRYREAEPLYQQALAILEQALGPEHPLTVTSLNNLAELYKAQGRYEEAEPLLQQALAIRKQALDPRHPGTAQSLNNLAGLYYAQGFYGEAEPLYQQALAITEEALGPEHPNTATSLNNLAGLYYAQGQLQSALTFLSQGLAVQETVLSRNLVGGSDANKREYLATMAGTTDGVISLHLNDLPTNDEAGQLAFVTLLQRKGRILDLFTNVRTQLSNDPDALALLDELSATTTQLEAFSNDPSIDFSLETNQARQQELQTQIDDLEDQLSRRSTEFAELTSSPTLDEIQAVLPQSTALVEFIRYQPFDPTASPQDRFGEDRYAAYVLQPDGQLQGIDLGSAEAIDTAVKTLSTSLATPSTPLGQIKAEAQALEAMVMAPVRAVLGQRTTVFLSPDSDLHLIPFEVLVDETGDYLVETYQFRYLTSGRDLMRFNKASASRSPSVLMGAPTFAYGEDAVDESVDVASQQRNISIAENIFPPLGGTKVEVEAIAQTFSDLSLPEPRVYLADRATEAQLKAIQLPQILHVATHGFFLQNEDAINPLLKSGLVFAGVKDRQSGPDQNGILTALEVTGLRLRGTQLVVLSACETGLGELAAGEGIYGLRRAFVLAGSQTQVISLWKVDDTATQELMVEYYDRLLSGTPRDVALRETQRAFLQSEEYSHPYYWAAFIGSGDWRPLQQSRRQP